MEKWLSLLVLFVVLSNTGFSQRAGSIATVKKVFVGSMGQSDEAQRFQLLLADELGKVGFIVTDDAKTADAVLTCILAVEVHSNQSLARVTAVLKTPDGVRLWGKNFESHMSFSHTNDTVKLRAQDVAKTLRKDIDRAGR